MKTFSNQYTKGIGIIIPISSNQVLTGSENGEIRLWTITRNSNSYNFSCNRLYSGHSSKICFLALLPNGSFISASADETFRIWKIDSGKCKKILKGGSITPSTCDSIVALPNDLIAISGYCSPAWECFDVWDTKTGKCIHREEGMMHRPHGVSLANVKGYLAVHGYCTSELTIWKITCEECTQIDQCEDDRIYSMTTSTTGEIITGGFDLNIFGISDDGKIQKLKTIPNSNVIDEMIALDAYKVLTIDRQNSCAGTLKLWHYLVETCQTLGNSLTPSGKTAGSHVILPKTSIILSISQDQFCIQKFSKLLKVPGNFAEIRKNSRILAQAYRTKTGFFAQLPKELNIHIAALTGDLSDEKHPIKIASDHFYKPPSL